MILFLVALFAFAVPSAHASTIVWSQTFNEFSPVPFMSNEAFMLPPLTTTFAGSGFSNFTSLGWTGASYGNYALAKGPATSNMNFDLSFDTAMSQPFNFILLIWENAPVTSNIFGAFKVAWTGGLWLGNGIVSDGITFDGNVLNRSTNTPVPEPGTMLLLGSGLVGLAGFGRKKLSGFGKLRV